MNVLIIQNVNSVYSIKIRLMKNTYVIQVFLIVVLSKTEIIMKWNVWIMKHVKITMEIIKCILICQKKSVYLVVKHNTYIQNIHKMTNYVLNVVIVTDSINQVVVNIIVLNQFVHHLTML